MISSGKGRTTCPFFTKDGKHIIYASTHLAADTCPPVPDRSKYGNKYIWPLYDSYDIFMADLDGKIIRQLTNAKGYDAEATLSPDGKKMIYTSDKDGDIDLYIMDFETGKEKRVTNTLGYDGGAWFSPDGNKIIWRASRPKTDAAVKEYKDLLAMNTWSRPPKWKYLLPMLMGIMCTRSLPLDRRTGRRPFSPIVNGSSLRATIEYKRGFPFNLYSINERWNRPAIRSRRKKYLMPFRCSLLTERRSFFAAIETMAEPRIPIFSLRIGWNEIMKQVLILKRVSCSFGQPK